MNIRLKIGILAILILFVGGVFVSIERSGRIQSTGISEDREDIVAEAVSLEGDDVATGIEIVAAEALDSEVPSASLDLSAKEIVEEDVALAVEPVIKTEVLYKSAITTVFWVGEGPDSSNDFISNSQSAWDVDWQEHYGGIDDPFDRCGFNPCHVTPLENPFYVALPYNDFSSRGVHKTSAESIPWYYTPESSESLLKNQWIEIVHDDVVCYAQWEDVGPNESDDFAYVFGSSKVPKNTFSAQAGLDISPAVRDCLQVGGVSETRWRFVDEEEVPSGPWSEIVTSSQVDWQ